MYRVPYSEDYPQLNDRYYVFNGGFVADNFLKDGELYGQAYYDRNYSNKAGTKQLDKNKRYMEQGIELEPRPLTDKEYKKLMEYGYGNDEDIIPF